MSDPDKWLKNYKDRCIEEAEQDPIKTKAAKRHIRQLDDLWRLLPREHKSTVMKMSQGKP